MCSNLVFFRIFSWSLTMESGWYISPVLGEGNIQGLSGCFSCSCRSSSTADSGIEIFRTEFSVFGRLHFRPHVSPLFSGVKQLFGSSRRTCQIRLICEWDFGLTCLTDPHRLEKILPFQTPRKSGPMGAGMGIRGCFLTPVAKASHRPIQLGQRGDPALSPSDRSNARTLH